MVDEQLENWQRYYKDSYARRRRTLSLEGRYQIERKDMDYEEESPPPARKPLNRKEAEIMEDIIITLPFTMKLIICVEYMYRWALNGNSFHKTCIIAKTKQHLWNSDLNKAKLIIEHRLINTIDLPLSKRYTADTI
jgi:hypothetical protein